MGATNEETRDRFSVYRDVDNFENNDRDDSDAGSRIFNRVGSVSEISR